MGNKSPIPDVYRLAGARRHYNAVRRRKAEARRLAVGRLLVRWGWSWGSQARIAGELGVSRVTICRDLQHLELMQRGYTTEQLAMIDRDSRTVAKLVHEPAEKGC